jgi:ribosome-associated toxin RatA of RatAB toxin-antitoxin module
MSAMKELSGAATEVVSAPIEQCFALLQAVDHYPDWHPEVVREVEVLRRDAQGSPTKARTTLHVARGPLVRDFRLLMDVAARPPAAVTLVRVRNDPSDQEQFEVRWQLQEERSRTEVRLGVHANLSVPRLVPVGGIGDAMAQGFVDAAVRALRR